MRAVIQRVSQASVEVDGDCVGAIGPGLLVLLGVGPASTAADREWMARKIAGLRIFSDEEGKMNRSVQDIGGGILVVSQFTLYGDCRKGFRPSFTGAADPVVAEREVETFVASLRAEGLPVETGVFAADMKVSLLNDGPVTLILEREGS